MVTRATPPAAEPSGDDAPVTRGELKAAIAEAIGGTRTEPEASPPAPPPTEAKPRGPREEEDRMEALVSAKVKEVLAAEGGKKEPEKAPGSHEPEQPPQDAGGFKRKLEKVMGWS